MKDTIIAFFLVVAILVVTIGLIGFGIGYYVHGHSISIQIK